MSNDDLGISVPGAVGGFLSRDLIGRLICLRPTRHDEPLETAMGESLATWCDVLVVNENDPGDAPYENAGEVPIFWLVVRRQLHDAAPWMAGRIRKVEAKSGGEGRAYRLYPPEGAEMEACRVAIKRHINDPLPYAGIQESLEGEGKPF